MQTKKLAALLLAFGLLTSGSVVASAHRGGNHHSENSMHHSVCRYEGCTNGGLHRHHGDDATYTAYRAYTTSETPAYIPCTVSNCAQTGVHSHDGVPYCDHHGQASYAPCNSYDCDLVDYHEHDGTGYYGHYNADGTVAYIPQTK